MIPRRDAWTIYALMVCQGFLFYGVGYLTPYVESELRAPAWASVLPNSVMALGLLAAGVAVPRAVARFGAWGAARWWAILLAVGAALVAVGGSLVPILPGAFLVGIAGAGALTHAVNTFAGSRGGVLLVRATLASVGGGVLGPLVLSAAARGIGWNLGMLAPLPALAVLALVVRPGAAGEARRDPAGRLAEPPVGRGYALAWTFLALCIGAESSFVTWGAQVAVERTGMALADATALGSLFVAGLVIGRVALGAGAGGGVGRRRLLAGMAVTGVAGGLLVWLAPMTAVAGGGLLVGGLGMAGAWPTAAGLAMAHARRSPVIAGARLNLASGVAVLGAPLALGVAATLGGVLAAWAIVVGLLVAALVVLRLVPDPD